MRMYRSLALVPVLLLAGCASEENFSASDPGLEQQCAAEGDLMTRYLDITHKLRTGEVGAEEVTAVEAEIAAEWSELSEHADSAVAPIFGKLAELGAHGGLEGSPEMSRALDVLAGVCEFAGYQIVLQPAAGG